MRKTISKYRGFIIDKVIDEAFPSWVDKTSENNLYLLLSAMLSPFESIFHANQYLTHETDFIRASLLDTVRFFYFADDYSDIFTQTLYDNHGLSESYNTNVVRTTNDFFSSGVGALTFKTRISVPLSNYIPSLYWNDSDIILDIFPDSISDYYESIYPFTSWTTKTNDDKYVIRNTEYLSYPNYYNPYAHIGDDTIVTEPAIIDYDKIVVTDIHHYYIDTATGERVYYTWTLYPGDVKTITAYDQPSVGWTSALPSDNSYPFNGTGGTYEIIIHFTENHEFYIERPSSPTYYIEEYTCSRVLYDSPDHAAYISINPTAKILDQHKEVSFVYDNIENVYNTSTGIWEGAYINFTTTDLVDEFLQDIRFHFYSGYIFNNETKPMSFQNNGDLSSPQVYLTDFGQGESSNWVLDNVHLVAVRPLEDIYVTIDSIPTLVYQEGTLMTYLFDINITGDSFTVTYNGDDLTDSYDFEVIIGYEAHLDISDSILDIGLNDNVEYDSLLLGVDISYLIDWNSSSMDSNMLNRDKFLTGTLKADSLGVDHLQDFVYVKDMVVTDNHLPMSIEVHRYDLNTLHLIYANGMEEKVKLEYNSSPIDIKSISYYDAYIFILGVDGFIYTFDIYNNEVNRMVSAKNFSNYNWIRTGVGNSLYIFNQYFFDVYEYVYDNVLYDFSRNAFTVRY